MIAISFFETFQTGPVLEKSMGLWYFVCKIYAKSEEISRWFANNNSRIYSTAYLRRPLKQLRKPLVLSLQNTTSIDKNVLSSFLLLKPDLDRKKLVKWRQIVCAGGFWAGLIFRSPLGQEAFAFWFSYHSLRKVLSFGLLIRTAGSENFFNYL